MGAVEKTREALNGVLVQVSELPDGLRFYVSRKVLDSMTAIDEHIAKAKRPVSLDEVAESVSEAARLLGWDPIMWGDEAYDPEEGYQSINPGTRQFAEQLLKDFTVDRRG